MNRLTSYATMFVFAATCSLPSAAQNCDISPGSVGLGNYCGDARKLSATTVVVPVIVEPDKSTVSAPPATTFQLKPPETVRSALERWAGQADWIFGSQHYAVTVDFPVVATTDEIPKDFKAAVRMLLDSTSLTDTPAQPCFYSNRVLRVVPRHELCARP
jgi:hypothetical protein